MSELTPKQERVLRAIHTLRRARTEEIVQQLHLASARTLGLLALEKAGLIEYSRYESWKLTMKGLDAIGERRER